MLLPLDHTVVYFVTFCVARRRPVLADPKIFAAFRQAIDAASRWQVIGAVLMPDHVHLLAAPVDDSSQRGRSRSGTDGFCLSVN